MTHDAGLIETHYEMNEFRATVRVRNPAAVQYFDGFYDRVAEPAADPRLQLALLDIEPPGWTGGSDESIDVDGCRVQAARTADGYAVWTADGGPYHVWTAARRLLRDLWLVRRTQCSAVATVHASAIDDGTNLVLFVGDKGAGKTTLMLDATLCHGWRMLANDCFIVYTGEHGVSACGQPTYLGIRPDVVARFDELLLTRIRNDAANQASHARWSATPPESTRPHKLHLSYGAISRPVFPTIRLTDRRITIVAVRYCPEVGSGGLTPLTADPVDFLASNHKPLRYLVDWVAPGVTEAATDRACLTRLARQARFLEYRHNGSCVAVLQHLTSDSLSGVG
jgi:hypothetical protein